MKPSVGRIVHYVGEDGPDCVAAIVVGVSDGHDVDLTVFPRQGMPAYQVAEVVLDDRSPSARIGTSWHWPEQVPREPGDRPPQH